MKTKTLVVLALLFAATTVAQAETVRAFVRPSIGYTKPDKGDYDGTAVFGIAGGVSLGNAEQHEFSLEFLFSGWTTRYYSERSGRWPGDVTEARMPILANYRFYMRSPKSRVGFYVGAGVGGELVTVSSDYERGRYSNYYDGYYTESDSSISFAAAGTAGISINLGRFVDLDIGYRGMWQSGCTTNVYTDNYYTTYSKDTPKGWVHFVTVGASVRF